MALFYDRMLNLCSVHYRQLKYIEDGESMKYLGTKDWQCTKIYALYFLMQNIEELVGKCLVCLMDNGILEPKGWTVLCCVRVK